APEGDMIHELQRRRAEVFTQRDDVALATEAAEDALQRALRLKDALEEGATRRVMASIHTVEGRPTDAFAQSRQAIRLLEGIHERFELARAYREQAQRAKGDPDPERLREAQNYAFKAMSLFEQLGLADQVRDCETVLRDLNAPSWLVAPRADRPTHPTSSQAQDVA